MKLQIKASFFVLLFLFLFTFSTSSSEASCTYKTRYSEKHVDIQVENDTDSVANINIQISGTRIISWSSPYQEGWVWNTSGFSPGNSGWSTYSGNHNVEPYIIMWNNDAIILFSSPVDSEDRLLYKLPPGSYGLDLTENISSLQNVSQVGVGETQNYNCSYDGQIPKPTPEPTPEPNPETPVTKTVFVPGLGASWSLNDFISCSTSSDQSNWSLAPYAEGVYKGILDALSGAGWTTLPFYYDWRQNVSNNASILADFIDNNITEDEKVNFVGHSMGGLVGRGYMETNEGGKLAKYYSVGTPHQGSAFSYAPWEGGEVWTNNLIEKIGVDLYLKHCGGIVSNNRQTVQKIFPSIQNLLPTLPYLKDSSSGNLKDIDSMKEKNNFITENFIAPFWNVKVGTLSGNGQKTLNIIDVVDPSRFDTRLGNWTDGKPVGKEYTNEGDGTVLVSSSQLSEAFQNDVITQTHRGLVGSTEGINSILSFLGSPGIEDPEYKDDTSALVLVGYPGTFSITNEKGVVTTSEDGMIVVMNPESATYQVQFGPNDSRTTLIVDQFLSNGQASYKEYKYQKAPEDVKILEFNSKRVNNNPIHEIKEYKRPRFPIFWHGFWKWWIKYRR